MNLADVIESLVEEQGLEKEKVIEIVCDGILASYAKKYPEQTLKVQFNKRTGVLDVLSEKKVVSVVADEDHEIGLRKARITNPQAQLDEVIDVPFDGEIGRIEILNAKRIIATRIKELEQFAVYNEFRDKQGLVLNGTVHKRERGGYAVKIGETLAFFPNENLVPGEPVRVGLPIKVLVKEVLPVARGDYQIILDRASAEFVKKLFELEIPEIFEGVVEVKKIVRIPGYKSKAIVASNSSDIDPVGTCVGMGGARIKPILRELGQEKIDLIEATDSIERLVQDSLKPAEIDKVEIIDDARALVWLAQDQRSFAIGKMGQNISLAAQLVGMEIQLQDVATPDNRALDLDASVLGQDEREE